MAHKTKAEGADAAPSVLEAIAAWPVRIAGAVSAALILAVFALVIYAIFQRYFLGTPLKWGDEMLGYLLVALVMCGAAEAFRRGDHIAIDLLPARVGPAAKTGLDLLASAAVVAFSAVLAHSTWHSMQFAYGFGSYSQGYLEVATWIPQIPMFVGACLLGLMAAVRLVSTLIAAFRR